LWDVVLQVPDSLAKAEALISIGKLRAVEYAERISLYLRDLNFSPTQDADDGEKRAYGAIIALEKLRDIRGFSPVFFASEAWYSRRVRLQAERSLLDIVDDPTDAISEIVRLETPERKLRALTAEMSSKATAARKIGVAIQALDLGHQRIARDKNEGLAFAELRKYALRSLIGYKAQGTAPVSGCKESYERGFDDEERLLGLAALGANGADPAATALRDIILKLNADQKGGITDETRNRMARAAIDNAAIAKNRILRVALMSVTSNDKWSNSIIQAAQAALKVTP
ncbi:MAG: hypothetical protein Q8M76_18955, partial [Spirochaetaceae bacterium]|nr:hypothetical protein [Spirochaetaceae bacterium]